MKTEGIHEVLSIEYPDTFHPMTDEELRQVYRCEHPKPWGVWDKENHVMLLVLWKDYPHLLAKFTDLHTACKANARQNRKGYAGLDFLFEDFFSSTVACKPAEGYIFTYSVSGVRQRVETVLFKEGKTMYGICTIGRAENRDKDHELFTKVLNSVRV